MNFIETRSTICREFDANDLFARASSKLLQLDSCIHMEMRCREDQREGEGVSG